MLNQPLVQLEGVSVSYDSTSALRNLTVDFLGRATTILGPQHSGKSTLLHCINGMIDTYPDARFQGKVCLGGVDTSTLHPRELRRRVGLVMGHPQLFPMSVYDNVAYGPRVHGLRKGRSLDHIVETCLHNVGLADDSSLDLKKKPEALSALQRQQICLARVLALDPELLLFDEPTCTLQGEDVFAFENIIVSLRESFVMMIATRDAQQAGRLGDKTALLLDGELVEHSATREFFFRPKDRRTEQYLTGRSVGA